MPCLNLVKGFAPRSGTTSVLRLLNMSIGFTQRLIVGFIVKGDEQ